MLSAQQLATMLTLQDKMNAKVNPDWLNAGYGYLRAAMVESVEAIEHHGWKWWKAQHKDLPQLQMELVDIWHFALSACIIDFKGDIAASAKSIAAELASGNTQVTFDQKNYDSSQLSLLDNLELMTSENDFVHLTIAINYGGRDEVARAAQRLAYDVAAGRLSPKDINEETLPKYLDTHVLPDPDLLIRTSGEARISNFLLWQTAYSEYDFVDALWPDFTSEMFEDALQRYAQRIRRFGEVLL